MAQDESVGRQSAVRFTGARSDLLGMLVRGYLLMVPTIGLYRFWLTTAKRRFYWSNTEIDGDALEYTGNALQLLIGFLFALAVFVPLYGLFFYLSTQNSSAALIGYGCVAVLMWFLMGYATYRARDFRLARTLWRGIRFDQGGSAWNYASRRFGWSMLMVVTLGLVYPFMAANLWRYRYNNTWFGDRQFSFTGSWKQLAVPFYLAYFVGAGPFVGTVLFNLLANYPQILDGQFPTDARPVDLVITALIVPFGVVIYQSREISRMFSSVRIGDVQLNVQVRARALVGQYAVFGIAVIAAGFAFFVAFATALTAIATMHNAGGATRDAVWRAGVYGAALPILGYLFIIATLSILSEIFLGFGYWRLVARGATLTNIDSLQSVRARAEDDALAGEGLADALNVGAY